MYCLDLAFRPCKNWRDARVHAPRNRQWRVPSTGAQRGVAQSAGGVVSRGVFEHSSVGRACNMCSPWILLQRSRTRKRWRTRDGRRVPGAEGKGGRREGRGGASREREERDTQHFRDGPRLWEIGVRIFGIDRPAEPGWFRRPLLSPRCQTVRECQFVRGHWAGWGWGELSLHRAIFAPPFPSRILPWSER